MASSESTVHVVALSSLSYASFIRGYHDYEKIWTPDIDVLEVEAEPSNPHDSMATAMKRNGGVVGHVLRSLARFTHFFLLKEDSQIMCEVTGRPLNRRVGLRLEVPCLYCFEGEIYQIIYVSFPLLEPAWPHHIITKGLWGQKKATAIRIR